MKMNIKKLYISNSDKLLRILIIIFFLIAVLLRALFLDRVPGNGALNQDEALAGYEAWSLLNYGMDSEGYTNPIYFVAWGSGMNVLESYLMIPFIKWLGLTNLAIRLPSSIMGCVTVVVFYVIARKDKRYSDGVFPLVCLVGIAIIPWGIMASRWALESNLFPVFLLIGNMFLIKPALP